MVALDTALRLQKILQRAGLRTVMTRTTDVFVPLSVRSAIANASPMRSSLASIIMPARAVARTASRLIPKTIAGSARRAHSAADLTRVSTENRGIRSAEYYVLRNCRLPAVLVECGFLTNPVEAQLALTPEYRQQVAEQIAAGIIEQRQFRFLRSFQIIGGVWCIEQETPKSCRFGTACLPLRDPFCGNQ